MGGNIGGNFLGGNFPDGNFPGGSLMGGNFPGGDFPDTVMINKQKYCFERKNWIAMKAKKIVLSLLYHFCKKNTGIENI